MNTFSNFKIWIESESRNTFDNIKDALLIQIHPIKVKDNKELNQKRMKEYDLDLLKAKIMNWKMFEDLSDFTKQEILKMVETGNATLAELVKTILGD
jgi:hypothetical protein